MYLHVYIDFWISLKIIFSILFGEKKQVIFFESPKCLLVDGFAILDFVLKKKDLFDNFLLMLKAFVSLQWLYLLGFALLKNIFFFLDQIPGFSTGSITNSEEVMAVIIQQCKWYLLLATRSFSKHFRLGFE